MAWDFILGGWKRIRNRGGNTITPTYRPIRQGTVATTLPSPVGREHLKDIFSTRLRETSASLIKTLFVIDPDASAAVNAYLTLSDTVPDITVYDTEWKIDREGQNLLRSIIHYILEERSGESFKLKSSLRTYCEEQRYMLLLRGGIMTEMVFDRTYAPSEFRLVDMQSIRWREAKPGNYKPVQLQSNGEEVLLDYPTIFVSFYRRDPTEIYTTSPFVSAINNIAARQQVINDLYRIMQATGFPRIDVTIMEEILRNAAPAWVARDPEELKKWIEEQISQVVTLVSNLKSDQVFIHTDSVQAKIINDRNPSAGMDISKVIDVLNSQNQSALKSMATVLGRGEGGVNTASTETRLVSMHADGLNAPIADHLSALFTALLRYQGRANTVTVNFRKVELRPVLELEPQMVAKQTRLLEALSLGLITDEEFHLEMYSRLPPEGSKKLSGTGFYDKSAEVSTEDISPNSDPLGRSISPGTKQHKSNNS